MSWIVSIDIGGTKTDVLAVRENSSDAFLATGEGCNPNIYGMEAAERLKFLIQHLNDKAGIQRREVNHCIAGIAGISNLKYRSIIDDVLNSSFPDAMIETISDAEMAHNAIWGKSPGITLVVGTGSIAIGRDSEGNVVRSGGLGYQIGDEGSGYWLGKMALIELVSSKNNGSEDIINLQNSILKDTDYSELDEFISTLSGETVGVEKVADIASALLGSAEKGNILASQIAFQGAKNLAENIKEVADNLELISGSLGVGMSGSVIVNSDYYRNLIMENLYRYFNDVTWMSSKVSPVYGGLTFTDINIDKLGVIYV